ncbi:MAG: cyclic nucleotide-binding domain-containing protein [Haliea sp.]|nr:MAG: cyclic nucleotide-binding domain-containing protein [Haliea sp.]
MSSPSPLATDALPLAPPLPAARVLHGGLLALGALLPQALAMVGIAYAPLLALGVAPNPLWCLWSAVAGGLLMLALTRPGGTIYGVRAGGALLYGSTLAVCASLAPSLKLSGFGVMGLAAACLTLSAAVIWLAVRTDATAFARYLPAPVGRGLSLGIGLTILWVQVKTVGHWFLDGEGRLAITTAAVASLVLLAVMVRLAMVWRRDHPSQPYLLFLLPVAALCVGVMGWVTLIPFGWIAAPEMSHWSQLLPPWLGRTFAEEIMHTGQWPLLWTAVTVLTAQALFVAFTFIVETAGNAASLEQLTGRPYDLNDELRASALCMALLPWFGLLPASSNLTASRPLHENRLRSAAAIRLCNLVAVAGLLAMLGLAWAGVNRVPALFVVAALVVIGFNMLEPAQLERPGLDPGETHMWWQSWMIGLVFLFTSGVFAMLAGFVVAVAQFVRGAEGSVIRSIYTLREMRSRRWRSTAEEIALRRVATRAIVVVLQGTASFAVARRIREEINRAMQPQQVDVLLIDAQRVVHWDITALESFKQMADDLQRTQTELLLSHPSEAARRALSETTRLFATTDRALEWAENELLRKAGFSAALQGRTIASVAELPLCERLGSEARADLPACGKVLAVAPGQAVFNAGDRDSTLMVLLSGNVTIEVPGRSEPLRVATFSAGMVLGELAFLDGSARSARAVAVDACKLFCLPRERFDAWAKLYPADAQILLGNLAAQISLRLRFTTSQLIAFNP